jgi:hypothetical protein
VQLGTAGGSPGLVGAAEVGGGVGYCVGDGVVGGVGARLGVAVGGAVGVVVDDMGDREGCTVGASVGTSVGCWVGVWVGCGVVGAAETEGGRVASAVNVGIHGPPDWVGLHSPHAGLERPGLPCRWISTARHEVLGVPKMAPAWAHVPWMPAPTPLIPREAMHAVVPVAHLREKRCDS